MITIEFKYLDLRAGQRFLDIGCGEGRHMARACREQGLTCAGTDLSFSNIIKTRQKLEFHDAYERSNISGWTLAVSDITRLPYKSETFDKVVCAEVLEHIENHREAVSEILRVIKPGGMLAVSVPRFLPEKICWMLSDAYTNVNQGHLRIYKKNQLIKIIETSGAKHLKTHYAHSLHSPFWWLKCLLGCQREDLTIISLYHRMLLWDMMKKPAVTLFLNKLLNPVIGKSIVLYFTKKAVP